MLVQQGDTLWDIAQRTLGDGSRYMEIAEANGIADPNRLSIGQQLKIPGETPPPIPRMRPEIATLTGSVEPSPGATAETSMSMRMEPQAMAEGEFAEFSPRLQEKARKNPKMAEWLREVSAKNKSRAQTAPVAPEEAAKAKLRSGLGNLQETLPDREAGYMQDRFNDVVGDPNAGVGDPRYMGLMPFEEPTDYPSPNIIQELLGITPAYGGEAPAEIDGVPFNQVYTGTTTHEPGLFPQAIGGIVRALRGMGSDGGGEASGGGGFRRSVQNPNPSQTPAAIADVARAMVTGVAGIPERMLTRAEQQGTNPLSSMPDDFVMGQIADSTDVAGMVSGLGASKSAYNAMRHGPTSDVILGTGGSRGGLGSVAAGTDDIAGNARALNYPEPGAPVLRYKDGGKDVTGKPVTGWQKKAAPADQYYGKMQSTDEKAVMKDIAAAQKDINAGNYSPYFDVSKRSDVDPTKYPARERTVDLRVPKTAKSIEKYAQETSDPKKAESLIKYYNIGVDDAGSADWYFMGQLEKEFIDEYGQKAGREMFKERFADAMAATTGGADPTGNLRTTAYANYQRARGAPVVPDAAHQLPSPIGGRYITGNLEQYDKMIPGNLTPDNPKRYNFSGNFMGDANAATLDEQMSMVLGYSKKAFNGPEYGPYEKIVQEVADQLGVPVRKVQEVAWSGYKKATDKTYKKAKPMIEIVNEAIERTSRVTGVPPREVVRRGLVRAEMPVYGLGAIMAGGAAAGSLAPPDGGS